MLAPASPHWASSSLRAKDETRHHLHTHSVSATSRASPSHRYSRSRRSCAAEARAFGTSTHGSCRMPGCRRWGLFPRKSELLSTCDTPGTRAARACRPGKKVTARQKGSLWRLVRQRLPRALLLRAELFSRSSVSPRAGKVGTHAGLGNFSTAEAPSP